MTPIRSGARCHSDDARSQRANRPLHVAKLDRMVIFRTEPVLQHERRDAERVEIIGGNPPFFVHRQRAIAAARRHDHCRHRSRRVRRHVNRERGNILGRITKRAGRSSLPQRNGLRLLQNGAGILCERAGCQRE